MGKFKTTPDAMKLLLEGTLALSEVEAQGCRIDKTYLEWALNDTSKQIRENIEFIRSDPIYGAWKRRYADKTNLLSPEQFSTVVYGELGIKPTVSTGKRKRGSASEAAMEPVKHIPWVKSYYAAQHLTKAKNTYLVGIQREMVEHGDGNWYVHPSYNLNIVATFRSSCNAPAFQTVPNRNPMMAEVVRRCYIPRPGHQLAEMDYGQVEVRFPCAYNFDPVLMAYVCDPTKDMHKDMAVQIFQLEPNQISKDVRHISKNKYVFPTFYGSYYCQTAKWIWEAIDANNATVVGTDKTVRQHLSERGFIELGACDPDHESRPGTFEHHIRKIDEDFWGKRFRVYAEWKNRWFHDYQRNGGFMMLTGFAVNTVLDKKQACNFPIQGCLAGSSRVQTENGWIPIKDLVGVVSKVWTGFKWADGVAIERGLHQRARVTLESGLVVECDTRHKFKNELDQWIEFKDFKPGQWVALPKCGPTLDYSGKMNWWFIYGFIMGDGWLSERGMLSIVGGKIKKPILDDIKRFWVSEGYQDGGSYRGIRTKIRAPKKSNHHEFYAISIEDKRMTAHLKSVGFDVTWCAKTKRIPESVWLATPQQQRDFLEGLWLSDGSRKDRRLNMANAELLRDVQKLAYGLGFDSLLRTTGRNDGGGWLSFHQTKFWAKVPRKYPYHAIAGQVGVIDCKNYEQRNECTVDRRYFQSQTDPSHCVGERMITRNADHPVVYRYDRIRSVEILDSVEMTYTMSIDDPLHQFVADGVVHANCAFHALLWSLIRTVRALKKYKFRSRIIGEIHDCQNADLHPAERDDVINLMRKIMTVDIMRAWPWINVPLVCEPELCPIDRPWFEKYPLRESDGVWVPSDEKKWEDRCGAWSLQEAS